VVPCPPPPSQGQKLNDQPTLTQSCSFVHCPLRRLPSTPTQLLPMLPQGLPDPGLLTGTFPMISVALAPKCMSDLQLLPTAHTHPWQIPATHLHRPQGFLPLPLFFFFPQGSIHPHPLARPHLPAPLCPARLSWASPQWELLLSWELMCRCSSID
jgi:hypothetical protein